MSGPAPHQGKYFQFPLCALAYGASESERLNAIIDYGLVEAGKGLWGKLAESERQARLAAWRASGRLPADFRARDPVHVAAWYAAEVIGVTPGRMEHLIRRHGALAQFCRAFEAACGRNPTARIRKDLLFEVRDGGGLTYREFCVLAAIYSAIGRKAGPVRITQEQIRRRALGYKTAQVMAAQLPQRQDGARPLSAWILRDTIDRLHARKFFTKATFANRFTYYSNRLPASELRKLVVDRKTYRAFFRETQRMEDQVMTDQIRNARAAMQGKPPPAPHQRQVLPPTDPPPCGADWNQ